MKPTINISQKTILFTIFTLIGITFLFLIKDIVLAAFLAFVIMSGLNPAVTGLQRYRVPRPIGIFIMYVLILFCLGIIFSVIVPPLAMQLTQLLRELQFVNTPLQFQELSLDFNQLNSLVQQFGNSVGSVLQIVTSTFSGVLFFFTLIVMSFYLLLDRHDIPRYITWVRPNNKFKKYVQECVDEVEKQLGSWVRGQVLLMVLIGIVTYIGLTLLKIPYALPLAVLAATVEILPNIGPTIAAIPAILVALFLVNPTMAVFVALFYVFVQQVENSVIVPKILKASVDVDPIVSILLILTGFKSLGVIGALLAVPIFITVRTVYLISHKQPIIEERE